MIRAMDAKTKDMRTMDMITNKLLTSYSRKYPIYTMDMKPKDLEAMNINGISMDSDDSSNETQNMLIEIETKSDIVVKSRRGKSALRVALIVVLVVLFLEFMILYAGLFCCSMITGVCFLYLEKAEVENDLDFLDGSVGERAMQMDMSAYTSMSFKTGVRMKRLNWGQRDL